MRNNFLSKKLKRTNSRILIIDDNQIRYNKITDILNQKEHPFEAALLDDLLSFEKKLHSAWDLIIFGKAYDFNVEQSLSVLGKLDLSTPVLLLPNELLDSEAQISAIQKGIYDVLDLAQEDEFYFSFLRALAYSRALQTEQKLYNDLESAQQQAINLANEAEHAIAFLQDGIHVFANSEYLSLFGIQDEQDLIGQTILDILQPEDILTFKQRLKKITQGSLDHDQVELLCHGTTKGTERLQIELSSSSYDEEPAIQVMIYMSSSSQTQAVTASAEQTGAAAELMTKALAQIKRLLASPANVNALVLCSIKDCSNDIFEKGWNIADLYFNEIEDFLYQQTNQSIIRLSPHQYAFIVQAESEDVLRSQLIAKQALEKPQLIGIANHSLPLHLKLGYCKLTPDLNDVTVLENLVSTAFRQGLPSEQDATHLQLDDVPLIHFDIEPEIELTTNFVTVVRKAIDQNQIQLRFQQIYDKNDEDTQIFEVTSGFIKDNVWVDLSSSLELKSDPEVSVMLDRSVLVEAGKQLHNFITQYPKARLMIQLGVGALIHDHNIVDLISKLLTIIGSKQKYPIILLFNEEDVSQNLIQARNQLQILRSAGAQVAIGEFGNSVYSESVLNQVSVDYLCLAKSLSPHVNNEDQAATLQEKINQFIAISPVEFILKGLDDMTLFANAWNIDTRFLQGRYFQAQLNQMVDVQDN